MSATLAARGRWASVTTTSTTDTPLGIARSVALTVLFLAVCVGMIRAHLDGGGTQDDLGTLAAGLVAVFVEFSLLVAIVRPWSYCRSWLRSVTAFGLFSVIGVLAMVFAMHMGVVVTLHALWTLAIAALFGLMTVWSMAAAVIFRVRRRDHGFTGAWAVGRGSG